MAHAPLHHSHVPEDDWHVPLAGLWLALAAILVIAAIFGVAVLTQ
jgi:hypothetical protein